MIPTTPEVIGPGHCANVDPNFQEKGTNPTDPAAGQSCETFKNHAGCSSASLWNSIGKNYCPITCGWCKKPT